MSLIFRPDLFGEGVAGVVGGGGDVAVEVEQWGERFAHHGVAVQEEERAVDQAAELGFDVAVAVGGRAVWCGEAAHGVGFLEQLAAAGLQGLVGLLVAGDSDAGAGVGEPQGGERHARHRLIEITAAGGEAVDDVQLRGHSQGLDQIARQSAHAMWSSVSEVLVMEEIVRRVLRVSAKLEDASLCSRTAAS